MLRNPTTKEINSILTGKLERRIVPCKSEQDGLFLSLKDNNIFGFKPYFISRKNLGKVLFYNASSGDYYKLIHHLFKKILHESKLYNKQCNAILEVLVLSDTEIYLLNEIKLDCWSK